MTVAYSIRAALLLSMFMLTEAAVASTRYVATELVQFGGFHDIGKIGPSGDVPGSKCGASFSPPCIGMVVSTTGAIRQVGTLGGSQSWP